MRATVAGALATLLLTFVPADSAYASPEVSSDTVRVLVVYHSLTGNTEALAEAVAEGARSVPGTVVVVKPVGEADNADLEASDAMIIGSPTYWGTIATPVKQFIDERRPFMGDKVGAAFATGGGDGGGKELVVLSLLTAMLNNGMIIVGPHFEGDGFKFGGFGVAVTTGEGSPGVDDTELGYGRNLGERVAKVAGRLSGSP